MSGTAFLQLRDALQAALLAAPALAGGRVYAGDALLADAHTRLHDFAAPGLGLLQVTDDATVEWDHDADDTAYTCATLRLTVVHRTPAATLQPWS